MNLMRTHSLPISGLSTISGLSIENQVILAGAQIYLGTANPSVMQQLLTAKPVVDWECLLKNAAYHGLGSMLYHVFKTSGDLHVPDEVLDAMKRLVHRMTSLNQRLLQELITLNHQFHSASLDVLSYKGVTLALTIYGDLALRQYGDLDFLISFEEFETACEILQRQGYSSMSTYACSRSFFCESAQIEADLHHNLSGGYFPFKFDFSEVWERREQQAIAGRPLYYPCAEDMLVFLCVQCVKDAHEHRLKLSKVYDIAAVIGRSDLDWSLVLAIGARSQVNRPLKLGLFIVEALFGVELSPEIYRYAHSDWLVKQYGHYLCQELFMARSVNYLKRGLVLRDLFLIQKTFAGQKRNVEIMSHCMRSIITKVLKGWWFKRFTGLQT